ncbi:beta-galactosidase [Amycolatopsis magusensis]|nr:beta-galactosidase [Amycolatopsis magusensis]
MTEEATTMIGDPPEPGDALPGFRLGVSRGLTYGVHTEPEVFLPEVRALGVRTVRVYLYWAQLEPEPGEFDWTAVDALLDQLEDTDELWITVYSTSTWATRHPNPTLPASAAEDPERYRRFLRELVSRCRGRVRFWQCDNEPCVNFLWNGSAAEYVRQLGIFGEVVRELDDGGLVVIGGVPPDALDGDEADAEAVAYFDRIIRDGGAHFDVFDIHPYGDPYGIPAVVEAAHRALARHGLRKPVVIGEYNGPFPFAQPGLRPRLVGLWSGVQEENGAGGAGEQLDEEWKRTGEPGMIALYRRMAVLPPLLQMFMVGCPPDLEDKRHRWNCRDLVVRNLLAFEAGVRRTVCWQLAPERPGRRNPYKVMELLFGKFDLMDYQGDRLGRRYPAGEAMARLAERLGEVRKVSRIEVPGQPDLHLFEVDRVARGPMLVAWERRGDFDGEDEPPTPFHHEWAASTARAMDALGAPVPIEVRDGRVHLPLTLTPVFIE